MQGELTQPGTDTAANSVQTGGSYLLALVDKLLLQAHYYLCLWNNAQQEYWIHLAHISNTCQLHVHVLTTGSD